MRKTWQLLQNLRGTAAVEFAVLAPVFALIAIGAYDFGNAVQTSMRLERAARAGAQFALVLPADPSGIQAAARAAWPDLSSSEVPLPTTMCTCANTSGTVSCTSTCPTGGSPQWTVTVTANRTITTLIIPGLSARTGTATVRVR